MSIYHAHIYQHHIQHVILCSSNDTQSSQVMATRTYQFITCLYIRTLIVTSKQVTTLSSNDILNQVAQWPPKQAINNHKPGHETDPQTGHEHRPQTVTSSPRRSLPSPRQSGSLRRTTTSPRWTIMSPFPVLGLT